MTTPSEIPPAETISTDLIAKLRAIAAQRRLLEEEEERILATLAGAAPGAQVPAGGNFGAEAQEPEIDRENLVTVAQAAAEWKCSAKTMRKRADVYGAIRHVGGAVYVDRLAFIRGVNFQNLPNFSISKKGRKRDDTKMKNGNRK